MIVESRGNIRSKTFLLGIFPPNFQIKVFSWIADGFQNKQQFLLSQLQVLHQGFRTFEAPLKSVMLYTLESPLNRHSV